MSTPNLPNQSRAKKNPEHRFRVMDGLLIGALLILCSALLRIVVFEAGWF